MSRQPSEYTEQERAVLDTAASDGSLTRASIRRAAAKVGASREDAEVLADKIGLLRDHGDRVDLID